MKTENEETKNEETKNEEGFRFTFDHSFDNFWKAIGVSEEEKERLVIKILKYGRDPKKSQTLENILSETKTKDEALLLGYLYSEISSSIKKKTKISFEEMLLKTLMKS